MTGPALGADALLGWVPLVRLVDNGASLGDALRIRGAADDAMSWDEAATAMADTAEALADAHIERAAGSAATATKRDFLRAATGCLIAGQLVFNADVPRKRELYRKLRTTVGASAAHEEHVLVERTVAFGGSTICGWMVVPRGVANPDVVVIVSGMNGWGAAYLGMARALADRGLAVFLPELPGQGTTRLEYGLFAGADLPAALRACIDAVQAEGVRIGVWGNSFGGLVAALTAASDPRIAACCVNSAPARLPPFSSDFKPAAEMMQSLFGSTDSDEINRTIDQLAFGPDLRLDAPVLLLLGGRDPLVGGDAVAAFERAARRGCRRVTWEDGGHTLYEYQVERNALVGDWFVDRFDGSG